MQRFFVDFDAIDWFTLNLDYHQDVLQCPHCSKREQLVSHGWIYKQRSGDEREAVGKRIFCSNRNQRSGCGRTVQFYVAHRVPAMKYDAAHMFVFVLYLLLGLAVGTAYCMATRQSEPRNAWRWLDRLELNLSNFRCTLNTRPEAPCVNFRYRARRLRLLLSTLSPLFLQLNQCACSNYQLEHQCAFI